MRIAFFAWRDLAHPNAGGSEVVVDMLARRLVARGHHVTLACGGPVGDRPYPVVPLGSTYGQYLRAPLAHARWSQPCDLVVDVVNGMPYFSPLWRKGPTLALVHHVHDEQWAHYFPPPVAAVGRQLECRAMPRVYGRTDFLTISASSRDRLVGIGVDPAHIHVMHSGLDDDAFAAGASRSATPRFLALARIAANKRIDLLLDLWERVRPVTGGELVIAGDGPDLPALRERAGQAVTFTGRVTEERKRELLGESWLLVHPALQEGWGLVIMEAAAQATPAVGFDVVGVRDTIVDGITGELAADADAFVASWIALAADHDRRALLGAQARTRAGEFTWDAAVDAFEKAAERAMARERGWLASPPSPTSPSPSSPSPTSTSPSPTSTATSSPRPSRVPASRPPVRRASVRRSRELIELFRKEQVDPDAFYRYLAADTVEHLRGVLDLDGARSVDVGGGPGYTAEALRDAGASCTVVEYTFEELLLHDRRPDVAVQGDGCRLPIASGSVDLCHSSNVLEHVPDPWAMLAEMARVIRPGSGIGYLTFTNWYSPWGGHETSPWHYLGGDRAARQYRRRHGAEPKNRFGASLHPVHIAGVQRWFRDQHDLEVLWSGPRYLPDVARWVSSVPVAREVLTWNLAVVFRRRPIRGAGP